MGILIRGMGKKIVMSCIMKWLQDRSSKPRAILTKTPLNWCEAESFAFVSALPCIVSCLFTVFCPLNYSANFVFSTICHTLFVCFLASFPHEKVVSPVCWLARQSSPPEEGKQTPGSTSSRGAAASPAFLPHPYQASGPKWRL